MTFNIPAGVVMSAVTMGSSVGTPTKTMWAEVHVMGYNHTQIA